MQGHGKRREKERKVLSNKRTETGATGGRIQSLARLGGKGSLSPASSLSVLSQESSLSFLFPNFPFKLKVPSALMLLPMFVFFGGGAGEVSSLHLSGSRGLLGLPL